MQALVNAFYKTLMWLDKATPEQIADNVPQEYWLGDKALYMAAVKANLQVYSRDGIVSAGARSARSISSSSSTRRWPPPRSTRPRPGTTAS